MKSDTSDILKFHKTKPQKTILFVLPYLAILATLYTLYLAKAILLPLVIATFIALFSSPLVKRLESWRIPRPLGSMIVLSCIFASVFFIIVLVASPAQQWWKELPGIAENMSESISNASRSLEGSDAEQGTSVLESEESIKEAGKNIRHSTLLTVFKSFAFATPQVATQIFITIFMIYFFLVYGNVLLLRIIQVKSTFSNKRQAVELVTTMQNELSSYVTTITFINIGLGFIVGCVFFAFGIKDAFLWGALAGVLNFAPYIGPMLSATAFSLVAYIQFGDIQHALFVPGIYLVINLIESQFITPTMLGSKLNLNPLIVFVWLILCGWLWGGFGMLVGVPLLVCISIYLEKTGLVGDWHIIVRHNSIVLPSKDNLNVCHTTNCDTKEQE